MVSRESRDTLLVGALLHDIGKGKFEFFVDELLYLVTEVDPDKLIRRLSVI